MLRVEGKSIIHYDRDCILLVNPSSDIVPSLLDYYHMTLKHTGKLSVSAMVSDDRGVYAKRLDMSKVGTALQVTYWDHDYTCQTYGMFHNGTSIEFILNRLMMWIEKERVKFVDTFPDFLFDEVYR